MEKLEGEEDIASYFPGDGDPIFVPSGGEGDDAFGGEPPGSHASPHVGPFDPVVHHEKHGGGGAEQDQQAKSDRGTPPPPNPPNPSQVLFHQRSFAREIYQADGILWDSDKKKPSDVDNKDKGKKGGAKRVGDAASADISVPTEEGDSELLGSVQSDDSPFDENENQYDVGASIIEEIDDPFGPLKTPKTEADIAFRNFTPPPDDAFSGPATQPRHEGEDLDLDSAPNPFERDHVRSPFDDPSVDSPSVNSAGPTSLGVEPSPFQDLSLSSRASAFGSNVSSPAPSADHRTNSRTGNSPSTPSQVDSVKGSAYRSSPSPAPQSIPDTLFGGSEGSAFEGISNTNRPPSSTTPLPDSSSLFGGPVDTGMADQGRPVSAQMLTSPPAGAFGASEPKSRPKPLVGVKDDANRMVPEAAPLPDNLFGTPTTKSGAFDVFSSSSFAAQSGTFMQSPTRSHTSPNRPPKSSGSAFDTSPRDQYFSNPPPASSTSPKKTTAVTSPGKSSQSFEPRFGPRASPRIKELRGSATPSSHFQDTGNSDVAQFFSGSPQSDAFSQAPVEAVTDSGMGAGFEQAAPSTTTQHEYTGWDQSSAYYQDPSQQCQDPNQVHSYSQALYQQPVPTTTGYEASTNYYYNDPSQSQAQASTYSQYAAPAPAPAPSTSAHQRRASWQAGYQAYPSYSGGYQQPAQDQQPAQNQYQPKEQSTFYPTQQAKQEPATAYGATKPPEPTPSYNIYTPPQGYNAPPSQAKPTPSYGHQKSSSLPDFKAIQQTPNFFIPQAPSVASPTMYHSQATADITPPNTAGSPYAVQQAQAVLPTQRAERVPAGRPPVPIVAFGFGGRIITMFPRKAQIFHQLAAPVGMTGPKGDNYRKGPVMVRNLRSMLKLVPDIEVWPGPITDADKVTKYLGRKGGFNFSNEADKLLWQLIQVAAEHQGKLRSGRGAGDSGSPEARIVKILVEDQPGTCPLLPKRVLTQEEITAAGVEMEKQLLLGNRAAAVQAALSADLFADALLMSSQSGDQALYQEVVRQYADRSVVHGSPLHTLYLSISGQAARAIQHQGRRLDFRQNQASQGQGSNILVDNWRRNLAALVASRQPGPSGQSTDEAILELGDRLRHERQVTAAHVCYLIGGLEPGSEAGRARGLDLVGLEADFSKPLNLLFRTPESVYGFYAAEILEFFRRKIQLETGGKSAVAQHTPQTVAMNIHKLQFANLLADAGYVKRAELYVHNLHTMFQPFMPTEGKTQLPAGPYKWPMLHAFQRIEDRVKLNLGGRAAKAPGESGWLKHAFKLMERATTVVDSQQPPAEPQGLYQQAQPRYNITPPSSNSAPSSSVGTPVQSTWGRRPSQQNLSSGSYIAGVTNEPELPPRQPQPQAQPQPTNVNVFKPWNPATAMPSTTTVPQVPVVENQMSDINLNEPPSRPLVPDPRAWAAPSTSTLADGGSFKMPPAVDTTAMAEPKVPPGGSAKGTPSKGTTPTTGTPTGEAKKTPGHRRGSPSEDGGSKSGFRSWLLKKLYPDATQADVGGSMEAYYDKDKGRWIFPGQENDAVADAAAGPPPTMMGGGGTPGMTTPPVSGTGGGSGMGTPGPPGGGPPMGGGGGGGGTPVANDPLASLMAPPPMRGMPRRGSGAPMPGQGSTPVVGSSSSSPAPPRYATFMPIAKPAENKPDG